MSQNSFELVPGFGHAVGQPHFLEHVPVIVQERCAAHEGQGVELAFVIAVRNQALHHVIEVQAGLFVLGKVVQGHEDAILGKENHKG